MLRFRPAAFVALWASLAVAPVLAAQAGADADPRSPRFLLAVAGTRKPIDVQRTPALSRRIALDFSGETLAEALAVITRLSGLRLAYTEDVLPHDARVHLQASQISVAGALSTVLLDAGVDVVFTSGSRASLVRRVAVAPAAVGSVVGRVTDAETGAALAAAEVFLEGTRWRTLADEDGRFRLADVEVGSYTLVVRRIGYGRQDQAVTVGAGEETRVDLTLDQTPTKLEEVVVTGTLVPTEVRALPTPVTVVTAADIEEQQLRRMDQIFRLFVPSAVAFDLGINPEQNSIALRGANSFEGGTSVKIFVDGIETATSTFTLIDPGSIERVEIIRGPQAATIHGPEAIGGVMQVFTKKGDPSLKRPELVAQAAAGLVEGEFEDGSALRQEYEASVRGGTGGFGYNFGGSFSRTGEWVPEYRASIPSIYGSGRFTQGPVSVDLSARYFATNTDVPNVPLLVRAGLESPLPRHEEAHVRQSTFGARAGYSPFSWWQHSLTVGSDASSRSQFNTQPRLTTPDDTLLTVLTVEQVKRSVGYSTSLTAPLGAALSGTLTAGFDYFEVENDGFVTTGAGNFEGNIVADPLLPIAALRNPERNTGYFAQAQASLHDALFVTGGVRLDRNSIIGGDDPVLPRVGLAYNRPVGGASVKLRASYGEAIRSPEPIARSGLDAGFLRFLPNLQLLAERQDGADAGIDVAWPGGSVGVTYYHQTARDLIQLALLGVDPDNGALLAQFQNAGKVRNTGLEFEAAVQVRGVRLTGNYAYTSSEVREIAEGYTGDLLPGDQVLELPEHTAALTAAFSPFGGTSVTSGLTYVGKRTSDDYLPLLAGECAGRDCWITYDQFVKANVSLTQALSPNLWALLTMENLSNKNGGEQFNYLPSQTRTTTIGLRARW